MFNYRAYYIDNDGDMKFIPCKCENQIKNLNQFEIFSYFKLNDLGIEFEQFLYLEEEI